MSNEIFNSIKEIIAEQLGKDASEIKEKSTFIDLNADSLDVVEMVMAIEGKYNIKFDENDNSLETVDDVVKKTEELIDKTNG